MRRWLWTTLMGLGLCWGVAPTAEAQTYIGQYRWQIVPYCNVLTGNITVTGEAYIFSGWDDVCGDYSWRNGVYGVMFVNPDGTIGGAVTMVGPDGFASNLDVYLDPSTLSGTWRSSDDLSGDFVRQ
jgi:hypothetical protein